MKPRQRPEEHGLKTCTTVLLSGIAFLLLAGWVLGGYAGTALAADLQGSGWTVQDQGGAETAQPAGQAQGQPEQLGDVQEEEPTFFDPGSMPDTVPLSDADWIFEVPINVAGISEEVDQIGIVCKIYKTEVKDTGSVWQLLRGKGKKKIDLESGSYQGNVVFGVQSKLSPEVHDPPDDANRYTCWLYIVGPDGHWYSPTKKQISDTDPAFIQMNKDKPFRCDTGLKDLPKNARYPLRWLH
jgi:hypothetical protein